MYFLSASIMTLLLLSYDVLLAYSYYVGDQVCCGSGEKGFTLYVHCLSSRVRIGDKSGVGRP